MTAPTMNAASVWLEEGRRAAAAVDRLASALVVGRDGEAAAWVALGIAQVQAERRRVAVADLVGDAPPLALDADADDPHGISDSFIYGVSLNKVARPADEGGNLFVLPSGSEAVATEEIIGSERWRRLASGFREVDALLLLAAQADAPALDTLAASVDGVIVAGDLAGALPDAPPPLLVVAPLAARARRARADGTTAARATDGGTEPTGGSRRATLARTMPNVDRTPAGDRRRNAVLGGVTLAALAAAAVAYARHRPATGASTANAAARGRAAAARPDSLRRDSALGAARHDSARADSSRRDSARARGPEQLSLLAVANPADSGAAASFSVNLGAGNTPDGATSSIDPRIDLATLPVITLTPTLLDNAPWYRMYVGAYQRRAQAESLLVTLRRRGVLGAASGGVVRAPYALLMAERVPAAEASRRVQALAQRGVPTYPLSREDGTVALYAGAFQTPDEAAYLARVARAAGVTPVLVYRIGRSL